MEEVMNADYYDLVIIGGGCNGSGVILEAASRGLKVLLIEKEDFASGTSSKSTKMLHGGVRYLQQIFAAPYFSYSDKK
jgi:glycerol-3-phosphate dehydrogenase